MSDFITLEDGTGILGLENDYFLMLETGDVINVDAETFANNNVNACEFSGMRALPGELVTDEYTGRKVLPRFRDRFCWNNRKRKSNQIGRGPLNRDDTGTENFLSTTVSQDDL